jgi:SAM-dependent methyltransferase
MDDRTFDAQTARQWIHSVEGQASRVREQDLYPRLKAWVEVASPERILEVGCGQGDCAARIDLAGRRYIGVDPSPFLIERAKELYESESRRFIAGNAYKLPFGERQFDAVFSVLVWHLLSDIPMAAREMSRVMRLGGHFMVVTANPAAYAEWASLYTNAKTDRRRFEGDMQVEGRPVDHDVLYLHTLEEVLGVMTLAGLQVDLIQPFRKSRHGEGPEYFISIQGTLPAFA